MKDTYYVEGADRFARMRIRNKYPEAKLDLFDDETFNAEVPHEIGDDFTDYLDAEGLEWNLV